jgi:protein-S-isoprenylcysteine O-methyltransferase Ste14
MNSDREESDPLVLAQNRTTHAVRALAISFVAAPMLLSFLAGMIGLAASTGNSGLVVFSVIVAVFASIWVLTASLSELAKSKVY